MMLSYIVFKYTLKCSDDGFYLGVLAFGLCQSSNIL